ncbi:MAG TPA: glycosyltransferase, partial [Planctomycetota bacterium]|nr:glycosyltransferase [Planctomycetota bacterium]
MKILHLSSEYPPAKIYGLGRFVHGLARAQAAQEHQVFVLTNSTGGDQDGVELDGVSIHRIEFPNPPRPADGHGEVLQFNHGLVARFFDRRQIFEGADVVCGHDWLTTLAAREIAKALAAPLVVTFHDEVIGKRFGCLSPEDRLVRELESLTAHDATHVIANSRFIGDQVKKYYGVEHVTAIPGGIDPGVLDVTRGVGHFRSLVADEDEVLVTFVGRLDAEKGLEELANAALTAGTVKPKLRFAIAGSGKGEALLRERLAPLGERARLLGYVKGAALALLYRASDIVVVPSLYEPFGLVALEAMLAGACVVVSNAGGLAEIVRHEEDGLVVPAGDHVALAEAIVELAHEKGHRERLVASARERARTAFSWDRIAERTRDVYEHAIERHKTEAERPAPPVPPQQPRRPLVSVLIPTREAPVHTEAALRTLSRRTDYPNFEILVHDSSAAPDPALRALVDVLNDSGSRIVLLEGPENEAKSKLLEAARGYYVCTFADECEVPEGSEGWLSGLVWLLETMSAESVSPTLVGRDAPVQTASAIAAPRVEEKPELACLLTRRGNTPAQAAADRHWQHPVRVILAANEAMRERSAAFQATPATRIPASIVVVAYNNLHLTEECLDSVLQLTEPPYELVLVDNGSSDGTREYFTALRDKLGGRVPVQVLANSENKGYVLAANQGIRAARGSSVVLLNNDATVRPGWLQALLDASQGGSVGVVTAKILNMDGTVQSAGGILHRLDGGFTIPFQGEDRLAPPVTGRREVENAGGPCMLLTRELLQRIGVFDEVFSPAYFEDSDLCLRARAAGLKLVYEPRAEVTHHGKATSQVVAHEGKLDLWRRFEENKKLFHARWARELRVSQTASRPKRRRRPRVLLCYNESDTTTAAYCETALREHADVVTAGRGQDVDLGDATATALVGAAGGRVDLLFVIEGENYFPHELEDAPCPTAFWAIDNHLRASNENPWHFQIAAGFDHVFIAQR